MPKESADLTKVFTMAVRTQAMDVPQIWCGWMCHRYGADVVCGCARDMCWWHVAQGGRHGTADGKWLWMADGSTAGSADCLAACMYGSESRLEYLRA